MVSELDVLLVVLGCLIFVILLVYWRLGKLIDALGNKKEETIKENEAAYDRPNP
jgi:hypothetical protein